MKRAIQWAGWLKCVMVAMALVMAPAQVSAQEKPAPKKVRKATGSMSEGTYRRLERIHKLMADNKNDEALQKLKEMLGNVSGDYEKAMVYQTEGFLHAQLNNYKKAISVFEEALKLDALPQLPYEQMSFTVAQLMYADGQIEKAVSRLERYMADAVNPVPADAHIMLASAYLERKRYEAALSQVDQAMAKTPNPKESWLQLKLAIHFELKQYPACAEVLVRLLGVAPAKEDYWKQLSSVLFEVQKDKESLAVLALAERMGFIDEDREIRNLANVYMLMEIPYKAGMVLQRGFDANKIKEDEKVLTLAADAWILSREYGRAEKALLRAAEAVDKGDIYYRLGQIYVEEEQWKKAVDSLQKAQKKGVTKEATTAYLLGISAFQLGDRELARKSLQDALKDDDLRKSVRQWLSHIDESEAEEQRMKAEDELRKQIAEEKAAEAAEARARAKAKAALK